MSWQKRAAKMTSRRFGFTLTSIAILAVATLLSGCGPAWQPPSTPAAVAHAAGQVEWSNAGQVTVVPEAANAEPETPLPQAEATGIAPRDNLQATQFAGKIENLPGSSDWTGSWQVAGRLVHVTPNTSIDQRQGSVAMGAQVAVEGWRRPDGSVDAGWITVLGQEANQTPAPQVAPASATPVPPGVSTPEPSAASQTPEGQNKDNEDEDQSGDHNSSVKRTGKAVEFRGTVQQMPRTGLVGIWRVDGRTINVNALTRLQRKDSAVQPGAYVQIMGWQQVDGSINAASIQIKKPSSDNGNGPQKETEDKNKGKGNGKGQGQGSDKSGD